MDAKHRSVIGRVFLAATVVDGGGGNRRAVAWSAGRLSVQNPARACVTAHVSLCQCLPVGHHVDRCRRFAVHLPTSLFAFNERNDDRARIESSLAGAVAGFGLLNVSNPVNDDSASGTGWKSVAWSSTNAWLVCLTHPADWTQRHGCTSILIP